VGARAERDPELPREIVAGEAGDRFQLARANEARALGIEQLPCALDGAGVHPPSDLERRAAALAREQAVREVHHERIDRERVEPSAEGLAHGARQRRVAGNRRSHERQRMGAAPHRA